MPSTKFQDHNNGSLIFMASMVDRGYKMARTLRWIRSMTGAGPRAISWQEKAGSEGGVIYKDGDFLPSAREGRGGGRWWAVKVRDLGGRTRRPMLKEE